MSSFTSPALSSRVTRLAAGILCAVALSVLLHTASLAAEDTPATAAPAPAPAVSAATVPNLSLDHGSGGLGLGLFDPSRASFHQSLSFGVSSGGPYRGTAGLYTASFGYKLANPLNLKVDLGAAYTPQARTGFGSTGYNPGFNGVFVQNLSLDWRPGANSLIRISYQDYRSPLQWGPYGAPGYYSPSPFGYSGFDEPSHN